ncbi:hypothetical protein GH714_023013 [Hevea brasiliensis]|uniref:Disease resistance protein At4g27190-like leucine-rich repeats domain-containing protein n=1 Tax=Hevea brasiliensis TaxID=3981 RepID=A0A6A6M3Q3_HEVBR|nr:hypothetical protein GH714_023013 [Hevea brasiliensis]
MKLKVIPPNVISSLFQLEELHMANSFVGWEDPINTQRGNASIAELKQLPNLVYLDVHIPDAKVMPKDYLFERLTRYRIFIGDIWDWSGENETSRTLKLKLDTSIQQGRAVILLKSAEDLYLDGLEGLRNVVCELDSEGFPRLKHLHVQNSNEIQYLIDSMEGDPCTAFPILESLVENCDSLKNLFSFSMVRDLVQLQEIKVADCKVMHEIVTKEGEEDINDKETSAEIQFLHLHSLELECLPKLTSFCSKVTEATVSPWRKKTPTEDLCSEETILQNELHTSTPLFSDKIEFSNLEFLNLIAIGCQRLWQDQTLRSTAGNPQEFIFSPTTADITVEKELDGTCMGNNLHTAIKPLFSEKVSLPSLKVMKIAHLHSLKMLWSNQATENSFCKLKAVKVKHCGKLQAIFPSNAFRRSKSLESLTAIDCDSLENVFEVQDVKVEETHIVAAARLRSLYLSHLPKLRHVWSKDPGGVLTYTSLHTLEVDSCAVKEIVAKEEAVEMSCMVDELVAKEEGLEIAARFVFPHVTYLRLQALPELRSFYPGLHISEWPSLKKLEVNGCHKVEIVALDYHSFQKMLGHASLKSNSTSSILG